MCSCLFLMIRRPPRSTPLYSSAASDVYKRQPVSRFDPLRPNAHIDSTSRHAPHRALSLRAVSYTHLRAPRHLRISYAVFCLKKKKKTPQPTAGEEMTSHYISHPGSNDKKQPHINTQKKNSNTL